MSLTKTKHEKRRRMPRLNIWLPKRARPHFFCTVTLPDGSMCPETFTEDERHLYESHAVECALKNRASLEVALREHRPNGFFEPADAEYAEWVWKHGRPG